MPLSLWEEEQMLIMLTYLKDKFIDKFKDV